MSVKPPKILAIFEGNYLENAQERDDIAFGFEYKLNEQRAYHFYIKDRTDHWMRIDHACIDFDGDGKADQVSKNTTTSPDGYIQSLYVTPSDPQHIKSYRDKVSDGPTYRNGAAIPLSENYRLDVNGDGVADDAAVTFKWPWETAYSISPKQVFPE